MITTIKKEITLLIRDLGGIIILFLMPLLLILIVTFVQDGAYKAISKEKIGIILVDNDQGEITKKIKENLNNSDFFNVISEQNNQLITENEAQQKVLKGEYLMAIIIPKNLSSQIKKQVEKNVNIIINSFSGEEIQNVKNENVNKNEIRLYFDPTLQISFKENIKTNIDKIIYSIENQYIYDAFKQELEVENVSLSGQAISFKEINPKATEEEILPNSVQHNVPAWALFAIFFIIIPLSANIVKEKLQGTGLRVFTSPQPYSTFLLGKISTYLIISVLQFLLMVLVGLYLFPLLGLPALDISGKIFLLLLVAIISGLSAISLGILLGTMASSQEQSAPLGATLVVILAAIGGVWVPVFAMPSAMQMLSNISPMRWALQAFYDILLRDGNFLLILPKISLLLAFSVICFLIAIYYEKIQKK
ncbi:MAG: ABC transporter permease [Capnocytophaga sp.]|nr:ABC transporter permease [Capnocytophaga sp.]